MIDRAQWIAPVLAVLSGAVLIVLAVFEPAEVANAYFAAAVFGLSIALGALGWVITGHLSNAKWFLVIRRHAELAAATLPFFALAFVPLCFALPRLYAWARPLSALPDELARAADEKSDWLNPPFFILRALICFGVWILFSELLLRTSRAQHRDRNPLERRRLLNRIAGAGCWPLALTLTLFTFDWVMSRELFFTSTILGLYYFAGGFLAALGVLAITGAIAASRGAPYSEVHSYAVGRLLLAFVIFWAYIAFSQLIVIYEADLPHSAAWYLIRWTGAWRGIAIFLIAGGFVLPFLLLLSASLKRKPAALAILGAFIVLGHAFDIAWLALPPAGARAQLPAVILAFVFVLSGAVTVALRRGAPLGYQSS